MEEQQNGYQDLMNETVVNNLDVTNYVTSQYGFITPANSNQLIFGDPFTTTISIDQPTANRIYYIRDMGADADFVMTQGNQTLSNGIKTFMSETRFADCMPETTLLYDLGSPTKKWDSIFAHQLTIDTVSISGLTPNQVVATDASSFLTSIPYSAANTNNTIVIRDSAGQSDFNQIDVNLVNCGIAIINDLSIGISPNQVVVTDGVSKCASYPYTELNTPDSIMSRDFSGTTAVTQLIADVIKGRTGDMFNDGNFLPANNLTFNLGSTTWKWLAADIATMYNDTLDSRSAVIHVNKNLLPSVDSTYNLGSNLLRWNSLDVSGNSYLGTITTRSGNLVIQSANDTIEVNAQFYQNIDYAGGVDPDNFSQNIISSSTGGRYGFYAGSFSDTLYRSTIQSYDAVSNVPLPLVIQPKGGKVYIGNYDATAQASTASLFINTGGGIQSMSQITTGGNLSTTATNNASSFTSGALQVAGGASIVKSLFVAQTGTDSIETTRINTQINTALTIGSVIGSGHTFTVLGNVVLGTSGTGYTVAIGNDAASTTILGNNLILGNKSNTGATNIYGSAINIQNDASNNQPINIGNSTSTSQDTSIYSAKIQFRNNVASAVRTTLEYFEQYDHTTLVNGPWASGSRPSITLRLQRIGNFVKCIIPVFTQTATVANPMTIVTNLPARFTPSSAEDKMWIVRDNSTQKQGFITVNAGGGISWSVWASVSTNTSNFNGTGTAGVYGGDISWYVT